MDPTTLPEAPTTTVAGPSGVAPGVTFVVPQSRTNRDSADERAAGLPLLLAGVVLMVIFVVIFVRARARRRA